MVNVKLCAFCLITTPPHMSGYYWLIQSSKSFVLSKYCQVYRQKLITTEHDVKWSSFSSDRLHKLKEEVFLKCALVSSIL